MKTFGEWLWEGDGPPVFGLMFLLLVLAAMAPLMLPFYAGSWTWLTLMGRSTVELNELMRDPTRDRAP